MKPSAISWCDYSGGDLNFVRGCTKVSEGCANCYAEAIYKRFGKDFSKVVCDEAALMRLRTKQFPGARTKRGDWKKPTCFVCDTGDLFHETVPDDFLVQAFRLFCARTDVVWQVLTKRPARMLKFYYDHLADDYGEFGKYKTGYYWPFPHVWLGVTAENQRRFDERVPLLLDVSAAVRFVSVEPMLGPVNVRPYVNVPGDASTRFIICGGESGPNRRPFDVAWAVDLYEQCKAAGVPFWGKQGSALRPGQDAELPGYGVVQEWPEWKGEQ